VTSGLIACAAALAVAAVLGLLWRGRNGRMREPRRPLPKAVGAAAAQPSAAPPPVTSRGQAADATAPAHANAAAEATAGWPATPAEPGEPGEPLVTVAELGQPLGSRATLLQFSTAFCAPCRATRRILAEVAGMTDGVVHVEVDAESRLDLVRQLGVRRTPTVFVLGPDGQIAKRASGQPRKADVIAALGAVT
jgi:thiol-disulfide isomerase/thioredoxin